MHETLSSGFALTKSTLAEDLAVGAEVADIFVLSVAQQHQAKNGPYWRLEFCDASGSIGGKIWSPQSQSFSHLCAGMMVWVKGRVGSYRDKPDLAIESMRVLEAAECAALDPALFIPSSNRNVDEMLEELAELAKTVLTHKPWRKFILSVLSDQEVRASLRLAPAAKAMHHAYAGGLLEHTLSVSRLVLHFADHYPSLDKQVLFAGAVCHDLGKLWELSSGFSIDYTTCGRLIGHISLVLERLAPFMRKAGLEPHLEEHLRHLILSHHGTHEFGSPRLPSTAEALVLHYADDLDAKMQQVEGALQGVEENSWSAYVPALDRFFFRPLPSPVSPALHAVCAPGQSRRRAGCAPDETEARRELPGGQFLSLLDPCSLPLKE